MHGGGRAAETNRCATFSWRRVQAPYVTLQFSRTGRAGAEDSGKSPRGVRIRHYYRSHRSRIAGPGGKVCGRDSDWRAQHAEFLFAQARWTRQEAGAAETRDVRNTGRIFDGRRVYFVGRKLQRDVVRARRADIFGFFPQYPGLSGGSRGQETEPFTNFSRPEPRNGQASQGFAAFARGSSGWCRWIAGRSASSAGKGPL